MQIHVTKQIDRDTGEPRPTKTRRARSVDLEPALEPLLRVLVAEAEAEGRVRLLRMLRDEDRAEYLREKHLRAAGCKREALYAADERRAPITFHCLRNTCLSHMAVRGDDFLRIQWRAGHTQLSTTQRYIDAARKVVGSFGQAFPTPAANFLAHDEPTKEPTKKKRRTTFSVNPAPSVATPMGIEPMFPT